MSDLPPIKTRIAGISFANRDGSMRQKYARLVRKGDRLLLRRERENPHDPNALAVDWLDTDGVALQLGYVPRGLAMVLSPMLDAGAKLTAEVIRTGSQGLNPVGVRMKIEGDLSALPETQRTGLEPVIAMALAMPDEGPDTGLAPSLGGYSALDRTATVRERP